MKRALTLIIIIVACVAGFLSVRGAMPFMAVFGTSMEPELHAGNLILIEGVSSSDVEVGDIIVFTIPSAVREHYNYPPVVRVRGNLPHSGRQYRRRPVHGKTSGPDGSGK